MKLLKDQRGVAMALVIVLVIVGVAGVGGFIWWRVMDAQQSNNSANSETVASANCEYDDQDLCRFMTSYKLGVDYKVESTMTTDGATQKITTESTGDGQNMHTTMTVQGRPYETIVIGNTTYTKDNSDGKWWKQTDSSQPPASTSEQSIPDFTDPNGVNEEGAKVEYKKVGTETCDNRTCFKYQVIDPSFADQTQYLWFDNQDYQLRRMTTVLGGNNSDFVFSYDNVSVQAPTDTKDLPANSYLNPLTGEVITAPSYDLD